MVQDIELKDLELEQIDGKGALPEYLGGSGDSKESDVKLWMLNHKIVVCNI